MTVSETSTFDEVFDKYFRSEFKNFGTTLARQL